MSYHVEELMPGAEGARQTTELHQVLRANREYVMPLDPVFAGGFVTTYRAARQRQENERAEFELNPNLEVGLVYEPPAGGRSRALVGLCRALRTNLFGEPFGRNSHASPKGGILLQGMFMDIIPFYPDLDAQGILMGTLKLSVRGLTRANGHAGNAWYQKTQHLMPGQLPEGPLGQPVVLTTPARNDNPESPIAAAAVKSLTDYGVFRLFGYEDADQPPYWANRYGMPVRVQADPTAISPISLGNTARVSEQQS